MTAKQKWVRAIAIDVVVLGLLYAGLFMGAEGAWNVFLVVFWVVIPLSTLAFFSKEAMKGIEARPDWFLAYHVATDLLMIAALAWMGHVWMAGLKAVSLILMEGAYKSEMNRREKASHVAG